MKLNLLQSHWTALTSVSLPLLLALLDCITSAYKSFLGHMPNTIDNKDGENNSSISKLLPLQGEIQSFKAIFKQNVPLNGGNKAIITA